LIMGRKPSQSWEVLRLCCENYQRIGNVLDRHKRSGCCGYYTEVGVGFDASNLNDIKVILYIYDTMNDKKFYLDDGYIAHKDGEVIFIKL
jgi:hypothetical protein